MTTQDSNQFPYHAFISYRRVDRDEAFARDLLLRLEKLGFRIAFDKRDFRAEHAFLDEMERCVRQSRFTLAVVTPSYLDSGNCREEAIICKTLEMAERKRRLVPLWVESVKTPVWLYGLTGVHFNDPNPLVDPYERVKSTLEGSVAATLPDRSPSRTDPSQAGGQTLGESSEKSRTINTVENVQGHTIVINQSYSDK